MGPPKFRLPVVSNADETKTKVNQLPKFSLSNSATQQTSSSLYPKLKNKDEDSIEDQSTQDCDEDDMLLETHNRDTDSYFGSNIESPMHSPAPKRQKVVNVNLTKPSPFTLDWHKSEQVETNSRPQFIIPKPNTHVVETAIPELFSPRRNAEKLVHSGLASSLRSEIMELTTSNELLSAIPIQSKIRVLEVVFMSGYTVINGQIDDEKEDLRMLLFGTGPQVSPQKIIQVNSINWSIELFKTSWVVILDWKILD